MCAMNYYKIIKPTHTKNPNYGISHNIQIPFRIGIIGRTGGGKTNELLNLIRMFSNPKGTFKDLIIYCRNKSEPLYDYVLEKIPDAKFIEVSDESNILPIDSLEEQTLVVFDDLLPLMTDKAVVKKVADYFIRGRKQGGVNGVSMVFLSQNFFGIPKIVRQQLNYVILKKINSNRDLSTILSEFPLGDIDIKQLKNIYASTSKGIESSLMIDLNKGELYKNYKLININNNT